MNQFRFANLEWLHALWLVALCGLILMALEFRGARVLERMLSPLMQSRLVRRPSLSRRLLGVWLLCGALAALVVALMRPQWGSTVQVQTRVDHQIMICLDVSRSMLAEDVVPNRLERAKAEIDSLLGNLQAGQQVGLMAFAGKASVLCPMTTDFGFLRLILAEASPATVGLGGTRIGEAISKAVDGFREVGDVNRLILLITDGEDHDSFPLDAAQAAREKGVRIISIGFGDELGSKIEITDPQTGARRYIEDREGRPVISRLDGETLRQIALETEGAYIPAGTGTLDWQSIYSSHIAGFLGGTTDHEETVIRNEAYQWCVLVALVLLLAALATPTLFTGEESMNRASRMNLTAASRAAVGLVLGFGLANLIQSSPLWAQQLDSPATPVASAADSGSAPDATPPVSQPGGAGNESSRGSPSDTASKPEEDVSPRELYNRAVALVTSDVAQAERLLNAARRDAQVDGELRYRAIYNLGWVEVQRAQELLQAEPEQALKHLEMAAGRFREAIRVRPDSDDARHNLEVISRRILELSDSLAQKSPSEFGPRLDEMITRIRQHQSELQRMTTQLAASANDMEKYRHDFRQLGVVERQIISDIEKLAADARRHLAAEQSAQANKASPPVEGQLQSAQISAMLTHLENSIQRMHKARSFVRRLQSERAFVRWAAGLTDAKRARDQLREPLEILSSLIADATQLRDLTSLMDLPEAEATAQANVDLGQAVTQMKVSRPSWLSSELVADEQLATIQRTSELHELLTAAAAQPAQPVHNVPQAVAPIDAQAQQLADNIRQSLPLIAAAQSHFDQAGQAIDKQAWSETVEQQVAGINALQAAAELFFDIRRLIDASLESQREIVAEVTQSATADPSAQSRFAPRNLREEQSRFAPRNLRAAEETQPAASDSSTTPAQSSDAPDDALVASQRKNLSRMDRLAELFQQQLAVLDAEPAPGDTDPAATAAAADNSEADQEDKSQQRQRLQMAESLRSLAAQAMQQVLDQLDSRTESTSTAPPSEVSAPAPEEERPPSPRPRIETQDEPPTAAENESSSPLMRASATSVEQLEELQRLFFSVVEHLRETAGRQAELNDHTTELIAQPERQSPDRTGPLQHRQHVLRQTAQTIAEALRQQAATSTDEPASAEEQGGESADAAEKLAQAATLVQEGEQAMVAAVESLTAAAKAGRDSKAEQSPAGSSETAEALAETASEQESALQKLLDALKLLDPPGSQNQNSPQPQPQQQPPQDTSEEKTEATPQNMDAEQMLQAIREREANRRRERQPQHPISSGGVEKDW